MKNVTLTIYTSIFDIVFLLPTSLIIVHKDMRQKDVLQKKRRKQFVFNRHSTSEDTGLKSQKEQTLLIYV